MVVVGVWFSLYFSLWGKSIVVKEEEKRKFARRQVTIGNVEQTSARKQRKCAQLDRNAPNWIE
jgi:hypothetical protein